MTTPVWDIRNDGRAWGKGEAWERFILKPEKIEMVGGKLLNSDDQRLLLLGLLLENLGADKPSSWAIPRYGEPRWASWLDSPPRRLWVHSPCPVWPFSISGEFGRAGTTDCRLHGSGVDHGI